MKQNTTRDALANYYESGAHRKTQTQCQHPINRVISKSFGDVCGICDKVLHNDPNPNTAARYSENDVNHMLETLRQIENEFAYLAQTEQAQQHGYVTVTRETLAFWAKKARTARAHSTGR